MGLNQFADLICIAMRLKLYEDGQEVEISAKSISASATDPLSWYILLQAPYFHTFFN
jgi:hypothetical protein